MSVRNKRAVLFILGLAVLLGVIVLTQKHRKTSLPEGSLYIDQLDIKTDNPQPAGRNLPGS